MCYGTATYHHFKTSSISMKRKLIFTSLSSNQSRTKLSSVQLTLICFKIKLMSRKFRFCQSNYGETNLDMCRHTKQRLHILHSTDELVAETPDNGHWILHQNVREHDSTLHWRHPSTHLLPLVHYRGCGGAEAIPATSGERRGT